MGGLLSTPPHPKVPPPALQRSWRHPGFTGTSWGAQHRAPAAPRAPACLLLINYSLSCWTSLVAAATRGTPGHPPHIPPQLQLQPQPRGQFGTSHQRHELGGLSPAPALAPGASGGRRSRGAQRSPPGVAPSQPGPPGWVTGQGGSGAGRDPLASAGTEISGRSPTSEGSAWPVSSSGTGTCCGVGALLRGLSMGPREGTPRPSTPGWGRMRDRLQPGRGTQQVTGYTGLFSAKRINYHPPPTPPSQVDPKDGEMPGVGQGTGWGGGGSLGGP